MLTANRVRELSRLRPLRAIADAAVSWLWILAAFAFVAIEKTWWSVLVAMPVIGNRYYALFIIGHDAMHRRLLPTVRTNDFWADLLVYAPIGAITRINNANHLAHHRLLGQAEDPDRHKHACFNKWDHLELTGFLSGFLNVWNSAKAVFVTRGSGSSATEQTKRADQNYVLRDFVLLFAWFGLLAGGLTWFVGWWAYPVLWLTPVYLFMFLGDNFRSFAEHSQPESDESADNHRLITYTSNTLERMLVAPMNMNFHAVHHLWPSIPYYNLPIADLEIRARAESEGLEWRTSYFAYLLRYWRLLPIVGCRPTK